MPRSSTNEAPEASDQSQATTSTPVEAVSDLSAMMASMIDNLQEPDGYRMMQWSVASVASGKWAELKIYLRRRPVLAHLPCPPTA